MRSLVQQMPTPAVNLGIDNQSDLDHDESGALSPQEEQIFVNPLVTGPSMHTSVPGGQFHYLGTSSNWPFGRCVLTLVHERVFGTDLPISNLYFDGFTYELGWDGRRIAAPLEPPALPTVEFVLFLINAIKFHCRQLFHVFDEESFMQHFGAFHGGPDGRERCLDLW